MVLIVRSLKGWVLPVLVLPVAILLASSPMLTRVALLMAGLRVRLQARRAGIGLTVPVLDVWPVFEVFAWDEYDFAVLRWLDIQRVIDCGAHVGSFSLWAAHQAPCQIVAVEPNPSVFDLLEQNLKPLGARVELIRVAIAGQRGRRTLHDRGFPGISSFAKPTHRSRSFEVEAMTLEDLLNWSGFASVDLLKMDIEGAEQEVFQTVSLSTLRRIQAAIIEVHPHAGTEVGMIAGKLRDAGMQVACEDGLLLIAWRERPG